MGKRLGGKVVLIKRDVAVEFFIRENLSQNEFAAKAGLSSGHMALVLQNKRHPSGATRAKLLKATSLTFDNLFEIVKAKDAKNR